MKQQTKFVNKKGKSAAGSRRKDKLAVIDEWSDSSSSDSSATEDNVDACSSKCGKRVLTLDLDALAAKDSTPMSFVEALAAKDGAEDKTPAPAVEALLAKDGAEDETPTPAVEALALKEGADGKTAVCVEDLRCNEVLPSPTRLSRVGGRSPSPIKPARDFVPSSLTPSACSSPSNGDVKVKWHAPLVFFHDPPASKRPKTSRESTPKTPEA
jgi:hypothetical protein